MPAPPAVPAAQQPGQPRARAARDSHDRGRARSQVQDQAQSQTQSQVRGLIRAADRLDGPTVDELLTAAIDRWGVETAWEDVIAPVLRAAGRRWAARGEAYIEVEHLLSWHVSAELRRRATPVVRSPRVVLLAAAPGEEHTLALDAVAAALTGRGIAFRTFGSSVPPLALAHGLRRLGPAAVVLWSQSRATAAPQIAADIAAMPFGVAGARHHPVLLLAGPGWHGLPLPSAALLPVGLRAAVEQIAVAVGGAALTPTASPAGGP
jgi:hypothetical protein